MTEYYSGNSWLEAKLDGCAGSQSARGFLQLTESVNPFIPQYYIHFTLARLRDGHFETLAFEEGRKLSDFPAPYAPGYRRIPAGNRKQV